MGKCAENTATKMNIGRWQRLWCSCQRSGELGFPIFHHPDSKKIFYSNVLRVPQKSFATLLISELNKTKWGVRVPYISPSR